MTTVEHPLTDEAIAERGRVYGQGESAAEVTRLRWQQVAHELADMLEEIPNLTPGLPVTDGYDLDRRVWPFGGIHVKDVTENLRAALAGAYAYAGAYDRAADQLGDALLSHQHEVELRTAARTAAGDGDPRQ